MPNRRLALSVKPVPNAPRWEPGERARTLGFSGGEAWQSNGGYARLHPARALPLSMRLLLPEQDGRPIRLHLAGIFALFADPSREPFGAIGGTLHFYRGEEVIHRVDLIQGRHYGDAEDRVPVFRLNGDGSLLETVDELEWQGEVHRVDVLTVEIPNGPVPDRVVLHDLGTPASFVILGAQLEVQPEAVCPFKGPSGRVALSELPGVLRLRDRPRFERALAQAEDAVMEPEQDLDEARGQALAFVSALTSAMIEFETNRARHRGLLEFVRGLEGASTGEEVARAMSAEARGLVSALFDGRATSGDRVIDDALRYIDTHFAKDVTAESVASQVGVSTSHFRALFRGVTGQPFNRYLLNLRLEKAREMLIRQAGSVTEVSEQVGFVSAAHFSRAFHKRFGTTPSRLLSDRR